MYVLISNANKDICLYRNI